MAHITLRTPASGWSDVALHWIDVILDRVESALRSFFVDQHGDFRQAVQDTRVRRLAAHGCNGQALI